MQDEKEYIDTERFLKDKEFWKQQMEMTFYPAPEQVESLIVHVFLMSDHKYIIMFDYQKDTFEKWEMEALQQHMLNFIDYTIDGMFEEQVAQYPEKIAIILEHTQVGYETLDKRANYIANQLLKKGIG